MIDSRQDIIIKNIAKENNISFLQAKEIWNSQFIFMKDEVMSKGDRINPSTYSNIRFPKFGIFYLAKNILYHISKYKTSKENNK